MVRDTHHYFLRHWQDWVLLAGFAVILTLYGYMATVVSWQDPVASAVVLVIVGVFIVVPFMPWFGLLKERWENER